MHPTRVTFRFWLVCVAVVFFLAGVVFRVSAASEFSIISPQKDSSIAGSSTLLKFAIPENLKIIDFQSNPHATYGQAHIHLWVDQNPNPKTAIEVTSDSYTLKNLNYGPHSLIAELVTNEHTALIPATIATQNFTTHTETSSNQNQLFTANILVMSLVSFILILIALYLVNYYKTTLSASAHPQKSIKKQTKKQPRSKTSPKKSP